MAPLTQADRIRLGEYELVQYVARIDQCALYRAQCVADHRPQVAKGEIVGLEVCPAVREQSESLACFEQRAGILLALSHPHIVRYMDAFKWRRHDRPRERIPCLVMELPKGEWLSDRLRRAGTPLSRMEQSRIMEAMVAGLLHAQEKGILPRHVQPGHVYLAADGGIKLMGFGLPRIDAARGASLNGHEPCYQYFAPDFARGEQHGDPCSLVFSVGLCFYELVAGQLPFPRLRDRKARADCFSGFVAAYRKRWTAPEPPNPFFPDAVFARLPVTKAFLARCLAVERTERIPSLHALRDALPPVLRELMPRPDQEAETVPVLAPATNRKRPARISRYAIGGGVMAAVFLALGLSRVLSRTSPTATEMPPPASVAEQPSPPPSPLAAATPAVPVRTPTVLASAAMTPPASVQPPPSPSAPPSLPAKALVHIYSERPAVAPPVAVSWRAADTAPWLPASDELELGPGRYAFRFARDDYAPVEKELLVTKESRTAFVAGPKAEEWTAGHPLARLQTLEAAWSARDLETVAREFAQPQPPHFAWPAHADRFSKLREEWFGNLKRNTLAPRIGTVAIRVQAETPPPDEPPVTVFYRPRGSESWSLLTDQSLVQPGPYELRYVRADYRPIAATLKVISGKQIYEVMGPRLVEWQPGPRLRELFELERAVDEGAVEFLTAQLAQPSQGPLKFEVHAQRLEQVRREWYQLVMKK